MELILNEKEMVDLSESFKDYRVYCQSGHCWFTREGDSRDLILRAGSDILVEGRSVVITALSNTQMKLVPEKSPATNALFSWKKGWARTESALGF